MAVRYYDEALVNKIRDWVIDPKVKIIGPSEARTFFRINSDREKDKPMSLPLISLSRETYCELVNPNKQALSYDGGHIDIVSEKRSAVLNAVPIRISYELSIYARYFEEADEYARNFIFNLINYPTVDIVVPYQGANIVHRSKVTLNPRVSDNSNSSRLSYDQYYRISINFDINDAYLFSIPILRNYDIEDDGSIKLVRD